MSADQFEYDNLELHQLWDKLCEGEKRALGALFERTFDSLYRYGYRVISNPDQVLDSIQDVFYQLWKYRSNLDKPTSVEGYLFISLRRQLLRKKEKRKKRSENDEKYMSEEFDPLLDYENWGEVLDLEEEQKRQLEDAIQELTDRQREVIYLKFFEGLSTKELANVLDIRAQSIYNLVHDAVESLRIYLDN